MSIGEVLTTAVIGMLVVMFELVLLAVIITVLSKIINKMGSKKKGVEAPALDQPAGDVPVMIPPTDVPDGMIRLPEYQSVGEMDFHDVDDRTAAMIMAIISDEMQVPLNQLRFKSIKELKDDDGGLK